MSSVGAEMFDDDDEVLHAASRVIESETANVLIEIEMNKAVRVGTLLRLWRDVMMNPEGPGMPFPVDWVDHASMDIFHRFFPMNEEEEYDGYDDDD